MAAKHERRVTVTGEVRAADLDGLSFTLRTSDGNTIRGKFTAEQEALITAALREHTSRRLRVSGTAEFKPPDGAIEQLVSVEEIRLQAPGEAPFVSEARPIWEVVSELGAALPDEAWAGVPTDLSKNVDHYLYGAPKEDE
jgi:hypothetical protein